MEEINKGKVDTLVFTETKKKGKGEIKMQDYSGVCFLFTTYACLSEVR